MKRKVARRLQTALDELKEVGQYGLSVTVKEGLRDSLVTSEGLSKKEAKDKAIRKADILFGVEGYTVKNFTKLQ